MLTAVVLIALVARDLALGEPLAFGRYLIAAAIGGLVVALQPAQRGCG